jgi:quercetin dioxygenase-like cupin family protein
MQLPRILGLLSLATAILTGACTPQKPVVSPAGAPASSPVASGDASGRNSVSTTVPVPGNCLTMTRTGPPDAIGCYMAGTAQLGVAPATPLFWHLDVFATRALAEAARRSRGSVVEAHGRVWLFTIAESEWRPEGGERVARVGPLPLTPGRSYAAHYIEAVVPPAAMTPPHRHSGPEAWYILDGTNCVMTPQGVAVAGPGDTLIVPEGEPMVLTGVGSTLRRTFAVIVHDASLNSTSQAPDWTPKDSCHR